MNRDDFILGPKWNRKQERESEVSKVLWCDTGNHAFSANDEERRHFTETRKVAAAPAGKGAYGYTAQAHEEVTTELDICGPCFRKPAAILEAAEVDSPEAQ